MIINFTNRRHYTDNNSSINKNIFVVKYLGTYKQSFISHRDKDTN